LEYATKPTATKSATISADKIALGGAFFAGASLVSRKFYAARRFGWLIDFTANEFREETSRRPGIALASAQ
jgi:hypothetical protein